MAHRCVYQVWIHKENGVIDGNRDYPHERTARRKAEEYDEVVLLRRRQRYEDNQWIDERVKVLEQDFNSHFFLEIISDEAKVENQYGSFTGDEQ